MVPPIDVDESAGALIEAGVTARPVIGGEGSTDAGMDVGVFSINAGGAVLGSDRAESNDPDRSCVETDGCCVGDPLSVSNKLITFSALGFVMSRSCLLGTCSSSSPGKSVKSWRRTDGRD